jgi:hypothetical protein
VIPGGRDQEAEALVIVGIGYPGRWIEENGDSSVGSVLVWSLELESAAELRAQAAPQIVDGPVRERHIGNAGGATLQLVVRPETRVDVDRLEAVGVPRDSNRAVCLHAPILPRAVLLAPLSVLPPAIEDATLP